MIALTGKLVQYQTSSTVLYIYHKKAEPSSSRNGAAHRTRHDGNFRIQHLALLGARVKAGRRGLIHRSGADASCEMNVCLATECGRRCDGVSSLHIEQDELQKPMKRDIGCKRLPLKVKGS